MKLRPFIEPSFVRSVVTTVTIIILVLSSEALFAQDQLNNLSKYWAYRQRLRDKFIYISDHVESTGHNIPASDRNIGVELSWGDANNMWNHYLGMLATELWLLKNNGQDYHETLTELYYAMLAIERLDLYSEAVYRGSLDYDADRNGLHNRDDVTWGFWLSHHDHFGISGLASSGNTPPAEEMSQDNMYHNIEGLALVSKLVGTESVAGIGTSFVGSSIPSYLVAQQIKIGDNVNFPLWVRDILSRYCAYFQSNVINKAIGPDIHWVLLNAVTGDPVRQGSGDDYSAGFAYNVGLIKACEEITGENFRTQSPDIFNSTAEDLFESWFRAGQMGPITFYYDPPFHATIDVSDGLTRSLATVGNLLETETFSELRRLRDKPDVYDYEHMPLYYTVLHDDSRQLMYPGNDVYNTDRVIIENLLNSAPTSGPNGATGPYYGHSVWGSSSRLVWPENNNNKPEQAGCEYSGLDYMVLHNLYYLAFRDEDFRNVVINNPISLIPYLQGNFQFRTLQITTEIPADANATYNSPLGTILGFGFKATLGSTVRITTNARSSNYNGTLYKKPCPDCRKEDFVHHDGNLTSETYDKPADASTIFEQHKPAGVNHEHSSYTVAPNPVKQTMVVNAPSDLHDGSYFELLSVDGQLLHRQNITASRHNVDISNLANGTYIVKFYTNSDLTVQKIVVMN